MRNGVGVIRKALKLPLQLWVFLHQIGQIAADRAVKHDDDHVFPVFAQRKACLFVGHVPRRLPDFRHGGLDLHEVDAGHGEQRNGGDKAGSACKAAPLHPNEAQQRRHGGDSGKVQQILPAAEGHAGIVFKLR